MRDRMSPRFELLRVPAIATAIAVAAGIAYWGSGEIGASRKLASLEPLPARANYALTLAFAPERFHQMRLQDKGRVVEVRDRTVYIMDVTPRSVREVAREYWVDGVAAWTPK